MPKAAALTKRGGAPASTSASTVTPVAKLAAAVRDVLAAGPEALPGEIREGLARLLGDGVLA